MTLPRVQPIAPTWRKEPFDDPDWLFDFKYDGFRALYYIEPGHNRLISRNGNSLIRFDALGATPSARPGMPPEGVLAVVCLDNPRDNTRGKAVLCSPPLRWPHHTGSSLEAIDRPRCVSHPQGAYSRESAG